MVEIHTEYMKSLSTDPYLPCVLFAVKLAGCGGVGGEFDTRYIVLQAS